MKGKYLKIRRVVIPTLTIVIMASQLMGCSSTSKDQVSSMLEKGEQIEIELVIEDNGIEAQGELSAIEWIQLGALSNYPQLRSAVESNFNIVVKNGVKQGSLFINIDGEHDLNNTLYNALSNKAVVDLLNNPEVQENISVAAAENYADIDEIDELAALINGYFNLLPDSTPNYFNPSVSLTRAESMALIMRAITPVKYLDTNEDFLSAVTTEEANDYDSYAPYAAYMNSNSYLNTSDESLNEKTFTGKMTRGEYIYLVLNTIYTEDEIASASGTLSDCTEGTDLKGNTKKDILSIGLKNDQAPTEIYKALLKANSIGVIKSETRWNEAITKSEAIDILVNTIIAYNEAHGYPVDTTEIEIDPIEKYTAEAKEAYAKIKDQTTVSEEEFIAVYVELVSSGETPEEAIKAAMIDIMNHEEEPDHSSDTNTDTSTEETTQAPAQSPAQGSGNSGNSGGSSNQSPQQQPQQPQQPQQQPQQQQTPSTPSTPTPEPQQPATQAPAQQQPPAPSYDDDDDQPFFGFGTGNVDELPNWN